MEHKKNNLINYMKNRKSSFHHINGPKNTFLSKNSRKHTLIFNINDYILNLILNFGYKINPIQEVFINKEYELFFSIYLKCGYILTLVISFNEFVNLSFFVNTHEYINEEMKNEISNIINYIDNNIDEGNITRILQPLHEMPYYEY